jgi:putative endonuclease
LIKNHKFLTTGQHNSITNDLPTRLYQHKAESETTKKTFAGKYNCYYLVYYEHFDYIQDAIDYVKELKGWTRKKKVDLIEKFNPNWDFLNERIEE